MRTKKKMVGGSVKTEKPGGLQREEENRQKKKKNGQKQWVVREEKESDVPDQDRLQRRPAPHRRKKQSPEAGNSREEL